MEKETLILPKYKEKKAQFIAVNINGKGYIALLKNNAQALLRP